MSAKSLPLQKGGDECASDEEGCSDRRRFHQAREAFDYARSILEPLLHPEAGWQGRSLHHVSFSVIGENFPHLAQDEIHALIEAVRREFAFRHASPDASGL